MSPSTPHARLDLQYPRPAQIAPDEWAARVQLAACCRVFDLLGWAELIYNHISLRVPGAAGHFLLNPFGLHYSEVSASRPVTIGFSLAHAFNLMWLLNRACEVQMASAAMGRLRAIPEPVLAGCVRDSLNFDKRFGAGQDAFDAMQRQVDRRDPSYRA